VVASESRFGAAGWSRFATRHLKCPPHSDPRRFLAWLLEFGKAHPGHVLYPTSDDTAWLYASHRDELLQYFRMYQPGVSAVYSLLNKWRLKELALAEGIDFPRTWLPRSPQELREIALSARFPVLLKPVTHVLRTNRAKGAIVSRPQDLASQHAALLGNVYGQNLVDFDPDVVHSMVQELHPQASEGIYSISGFVDEAGGLQGARASLKVLQRPRRVGVGVCFEGAEIRPELVAAVVRMCRRVGYHGVFEVEFIKCEDKYLMIDFNPRFYGQMAFDIARGLPVPLMVYHAALGNMTRVRELATAAGEALAQDGISAHCNRLEFEIMLRLQRLGRGLSSREVAGWRMWYGENQRRMIDPVFECDDRLPFVAEIARQLGDLATHPRGFFRSTTMSIMACGFQLPSYFG
jgi:predicted ATP-grasp superfamily ATP-dependent carboligase